MSTSPFKESRFSNRKREVPEDYWFKIIERLYQEKGSIPDPIEIWTYAIITAFGIPSGPYSAIELPRNQQSIEKDKIIAEYLTNKPGVFIQGETESGKKIRIISSDFRDLYPKGLPDELKKALDERTLNYMETEYKHQEEIKKIFGENTKDEDSAENPIHYFRLPGGIDLFLRGYSHSKEWQRNHGSFLKEANKFAQIICLEGYVDKKLGESLDLYWSDPLSQRGDFDVLMHEAVEAGFNGLFTEIDAREIVFFAFEEVLEYLKPKFFSRYFKYLKTLTPYLPIKNPKHLRKILIKLSLPQIIARREKVFYKGKAYRPFPYITKEGKTSFEPTFLELGRSLFSDALAAIKLHLIAKLMVDGYLEKGPIVDYEGASHLSSKTFFLKYPQYALEVVLRTLPHLLEGKVKELPQIYKIFLKPDRKEIVEQIAKLVFKKPENNPEKSVWIGPNQKKLLDYSIDFLKIYNLDPQKIIPSDKEIKRLIEKLSNL